MTNTVRKLIEAHSARINEATRSGHQLDVSQLSEDLYEQIRALPSPIDEIAAALKEVARHPTMHHAHSWVFAAHHHPSPRYIPALCTILEHDNFNAPYEAVVDLMIMLEDERAIPSLAKALSYDLPFDPTRELAKKILEALDAIGSPHALDVIRDATASPWPEIAEEARALLEEVERKEDPPIP